MDIIKEASRALAPISDRGVTVVQGWYDKNIKQLHITLWLLTDSDDGHSDDETEIESQIVQINIWSERDQMELKKEIKRLMKSNDFAFIDGHDELETDTRIFVNAMRFIKISEYESEE